MKRFWSILLAGCVVVAALAGCAPAQNPSEAPSQTEEQKLSVYASFYPMYDFASKIGGDKIELVNMVPAGAEPHDWEPTAADIVGLEKASVFFYSGAGMEHWVESVLGTLQNKNLLAVETSSGITLLEGKGHSHDDEDEHHHEDGDDHDHDEDDHHHEDGDDHDHDEDDHHHEDGDDHDHDEDDHHHEDGDDHDHDEDDHGHSHGRYDPHVWLSPLNAKKQLENIKDALAQADPANKEYYQGNYEKYAAEMDALDQEFKDALTPLANKNIVVTHQAFGYLCHAYGLNQMGIAGLSPEEEPTPARMAEIIDFCKEHDVKVIFFEELVSPRIAETIAKAVGAKTDVLSPIEGLSDEQIAAGDDYCAVMRQNLQALKAALQ